jgi:hypothetical protein
MSDRRGPVWVDGVGAVHSFNGYGHQFNGYGHQRTTGPQRALSLWLGSQVQTLLSREGREGGDRRTGKGRGSSASSIVGRHHLEAREDAKAPHGSTVASNIFARFRAALAHATQGRRRLSGDVGLNPSLSPIVPTRRGRTQPARARQFRISTMHRVCPRGRRRWCDCSIVWSCSRLSRERRL